MQYLLAIKLQNFKWICQSKQ